MTASEAFEAAAIAEAIYYDAYEQDGIECRALGLQPSTSHQTRQLWYAANAAWHKWWQLRNAEALAKAEEFITSMKKIESLCGSTAEEYDAVTQGLLNMAKEVAS